jgi:hypothetical protein
MIARLKLEEFIREKSRSQTSNQLVEEPSFHDGGILDHPEVVETS